MKTHSPKKTSKSKYRIFRVEVDSKTKKESQITMKKFYAENDDEAKAELKKYIKVANTKYKYYWGTADNYVYIDEKTKKRNTYDTHEELHEAWDRKRSWLDKAKFNVSFFFTRISDMFRSIKYKWFLLKTCHNVQESWSIESHIVDDIMYNVPLMLKNLHGFPMIFSIEALKEKHKDDSDYDARKAVIDDPDLCWKDKCDDIAMKMWKDKLKELLLYAQLYRYYSDYGIVDENDVEMKKIDEKYRSTIPYVSGTYKQIDYVQLEKMTDKNWNKMWDWMRKYGRHLWD